MRIKIYLHFKLNISFMRKLKLQELNRLTVEDFKTTEKTPIVLVLDNIRSGLNVGSAFRTADGFALEKIYLCGITAKPPHREILKTAIGATDSIQQLQTKGYHVVAVEQAENSTLLPNFQLPKNKKIALVFGNEVRGVSQAAMDKIDECLEVPQFGTKHSFNISVCVGIVVWEIFRKLKF